MNILVELWLWLYFRTGLLRWGTNLIDIYSENEHVMMYCNVCTTKRVHGKEKNNTLTSDKTKTVYYQDIRVDYHNHFATGGCRGGACLGKNVGIPSKRTVTGVCFLLHK